MYVLNKDGNEVRIIAAYKENVWIPHFFEHVTLGKVKIWLPMKPL